MALEPVLQAGFYFQLQIGPQRTDADTAFQEVAGLSKEMGLEEVTSGGENRFRYRLPTGVSYGNLVLKRGVAKGGSALVTWCRQVLEQGLGTPIKPKDVLLSLLDPQGQTAISWSFVRAYPVKWGISDLKSQENALLIESVELAYQYFTISGR